MGRWRDRLDVVVVAATLLVVTLAFGAYLEHRQAVGDARAEKQRAAICSILGALPPSPPPSLQAARAVFARPGHPRDCQPVAARPRGGSTGGATPSPAPVSPQILYVPSGAPASSSQSSKPRPSSPPGARRTSSPSPSPSPRPSPTCVLTVCLPPH